MKSFYKIVGISICFSSLVTVPAVIGSSTDDDPRNGKHIYRGHDDSTGSGSGYHGGTGSGEHYGDGTGSGSGYHGGTGSGGHYDDSTGSGSGYHGGTGSGGHYGDGTGSGANG